MQSCKLLRVISYASYIILCRSYTPMQWYVTVLSSIYHACCLTLAMRSYNV